MATLHAAVASFLDDASGRLGELASQRISWRPRATTEDRDPDLQWWSCALTVDEACRFYAGASREVWEKLRHDGDSGFAVLVEAIEHASAERFGSQVHCTGMESCETPPEDWASTVWAGSAGSIEVAMSPEALDALGGGAAETRAGPFENASPGSSPFEGSMDMLLHVEIPVSVSLGRTRLRMKDLVGLGHGSVVELDQELGDQVEIRVNNCVIARGEVVAVDGNYGVRILSLVKSGSLVKNGRGLLEKEAV